MFNWFIKNQKRTVRIAIAWTVLILAACLIPGKEVPEVRVPLIDKYVHIFIFAGFSFLWLCTMPFAPVYKSVGIFFASVALGYLVELLQGSGITEGRSYDMYDVIADGVGGFIGILFFYVARRLSGSRA